MTVRIMGQKHKEIKRARKVEDLELEMHVLQVRSFLGRGGIRAGVRTICPWEE